MRTRRSAAVAGALLMAIGASCSGGNSSNGADGSPSQTGTVKGPAVSDSDLRPVLDQWMRRNGAPGVVVGVQIGNRSPMFVVDAPAGGSASARLTDTSNFLVGGVADAFLGAAALQLADNDRFDLDATIDQWLPQFPNAQVITVRDLLMQRSGLPPLAFTNAQLRLTPAQMLALVEKAAPIAQPGTAVHFSRANAIVLGVVMSAAIHADLASTLRDQVFGPLGLHETSYSPALTISSPRDLLAFVTGYLRKRLRGVHDLAPSDFRIGPGGTGLGIEGVANDGICAITPKGCAAGIAFFAVGAAGSAPDGSAAVFYDPVYDISIVVAANSERANVQDLALRADLLSKLGKAGYDKTVGFTVQPKPTTAP